MKRCLRGVMLVLAAVLFALPAAAQEKTYTNEDFKFMLKYPEKWKMSEQKPQGGMRVGRGMFGVDVGRSMMPKMAQACFAQKKCSPGSTKKGPEYHLMMMELKPVKKTTRKRESRTGGDRPRPTERGRAKREKPECDIIARGHKTWAGKSTPFVTTRCPEKKRWRYTTMLSMQRKIRGRKNMNMYTMQCTLLTKATIKEPDSRDEYKKVLRPRCRRAIASSKMLK